MKFVVVLQPRVLPILLLAMLVSSCVASSSSSSEAKQTMLRRGDSSPPPSQHDITLETSSTTRRDLQASCSAPGKTPVRFTINTDGAPEDLKFYLYDAANSHLYVDNLFDPNCETHIDKKLDLTSCYRAVVTDAQCNGFSGDGFVAISVNGVEQKRFSGLSLGCGKEYQFGNCPPTPQPTPEPTMEPTPAPTTAPTPSPTPQPTNFASYLPCGSSWCPAGQSVVASSQLFTVYQGVEISCGDAEYSYTHGHWDLMRCIIFSDPRSCCV
uniref:Uncharacterized protein n=1 Tax=Cyclophora tenuis TaxID=216820 RepID=A0A7S1GND4_CYCTE|mmetsp:Transcript_25267/g.43029  ORF Transcript_25267/g.43029 Transcript_25267/m.43029 type:complete len:268 (+) Transcript_25267:68-871(+)